MSSPAQLKAQRKYSSLNERHFSFSFNRNTDCDIIAFLDSQPNKLGKIKEIIRDYLRSENDSP